MTMKYTIKSPVTGRVLGAYEADTLPSALDMLARDAGYENMAAASEDCGEDPSELVITEEARP